MPDNTITEVEEAILASDIEIGDTIRVHGGWVTVSHVIDKPGFDSEESGLAVSVFGSQHTFHYYLSQQVTRREKPTMPLAVNPVCTRVVLGSPVEDPRLNPQHPHNHVTTVRATSGETSAPIAARSPRSSRD